MEPEPAIYMPTQNMPNILCCLCGTSIAPNPANMCVNCIRSQVDITEGIPKQASIYFCKFCESYLQPPKTWVHCQLESKELLALCLKRLRGLNKVKLVDASFKWTEPHSRRILLRLAIQKEVFTNTILQQEFLVEFIVENQQCLTCIRSATNVEQWTAVAQVRQKISHKRTFYHLEQLILKHNAHEDALGIKQQPDGIDFFFQHKSHCHKFISFLNHVVPIRFKTSEHLVSHDDANNIFNYKYTFSVEIVPICRDDLICLPPKYSKSLGGIGPLVLCTKVTQTVQFIDPLTLRKADIRPEIFWKAPFEAMMCSKQLVEYTLLDHEPTGNTSGKFSLADITVAKSSDLGKNDEVHFVTTHVGAHLKAGDLALGYDVANANFNDSLLNGHKNLQLPDVVIVKKTYPKKNRSRKRNFKLRSLVPGQGDVQMKDTRIKDHSLEKDDLEREWFLQELEQDQELRADVNLYKKNNITNPTDEMTDASESEFDDEYPQIPVEELLDGLVLDDSDNDDKE